MKSYILEKEMASAAASSWRSPVPYLFCALGAMLGLIAFALLVLGCSYWKLRDDAQVEADGGEKEAAVVVEEKFLVIMAGQERPTFLATPASCSCSCIRTKTSFPSGSSDTSLALEKNIEPPPSLLNHLP